MKATKAFISYSWSSVEHEDWVLDLATRLRESGVDAILDKWDLKEGQEANAFMEKMVSDEEITKVIIVADKNYAEKSDSRKGGAGTEAQIISKELYEEEDQNKFVAVVTERNHEGKPFLPAFYTSRVYVDFSDRGQYSESFERLLRWIENKPSHKKPDLGKLPLYLTDEESAISLSTNAAKRRAYDAIVERREHSYPATKEYFELFTEELEKFRFSVNMDPLSDEFMKNFESFVPYRDECLDVVNAIARYVHDDRFLELLHGFFEGLMQYFEAPEGLVSYKEIAFDNYKFFAHELFLHCGTVFVQEQRPDLFNTLVENQYYLRRRADFGGDPLVDYTEFRQHLKSLEWRKAKLAQRRVSLVADMIKERTASTGTDFRKVMQTDFLLLLRADLANFSEFNRWWPETLVFLDLHNKTFEIFDRARSRRNFEKIRPFLNNATKEDLEKLVAGYGRNGRSAPSWNFPRVAPGSLIGVQNLCIRP
ncbi:MAG: TIR domain-containing protein [Chloroflexi bacterium]|nr:TIR domain-containing protein [Chloroflexota bacterium]